MLYKVDNTLHLGVLFITNMNSLSPKSLTIEWELAEEMTATAYSIFYYNTATHCFHNDTGVVSNIDGGEQMYTLTGQEEGSIYSITVVATLCGQYGTAQDSIVASTMSAGEVAML